MGEKTTLRMARQELEDLYLGVADDSVDLTFRDLLPRPPTAVVAAPPLTLGTILDDDGDGDDDERTNKALLRSSTNIFTYKIESDDDGDQRLAGPVVVPVAAGFELSPSPPPPAVAAAAGGGRRRSSDDSKQQQQHLPPPPAAVGMMMSGRNGNYRRPGIPHSNICALCTSYIYLFRHRCLVCGRVYCRRCVGAGMGDMTEGRKCIDCLGRRYSHRYIHKAGSGSTAASVCCCISFGGGSSAAAVKAQELLWADKGPAPRRRPRPASSSTSTSISTAASYGGGGGAYSASMSMTMMSSNNNMATMTINGAPPPASSSSFVANSFSGTNPHAFPL